jgi:hypothetical protein
MKYTAPAKRPSPDKVKVGFQFSYTREEDDDHPGTSAHVDRKVFATIKIVDSGFTVSGQDGPTKYSGTICSLEEPFVVKVTHPLYSTWARFAPANPTSGTGQYEGSAGGGVIKFQGNGPYTVEGLDTEAPYILWSLTSSAKIPVISTTGAGAAHLKLEPLDSAECESPPTPPSIIREL